MTSKIFKILQFLWWIRFHFDFTITCISGKIDKWFRIIELKWFDYWNNCELICINGALALKPILTGKRIPRCAGCIQWEEQRKSTADKQTSWGKMIPWLLHEWVMKIWDYIISKLNICSFLGWMGAAGRRKREVEDEETGRVEQECGIVALNDLNRWTCP